jgi:hypothetical protein
VLEPEPIEPELSELEPFEPEPWWDPNGLPFSAMIKIPASRAGLDSITTAMAEDMLGRVRRGQLGVGASGSRTAGAARCRRAR